MKELFAILLFLLNLVNLFSLSTGDKYSSSSDWKGQDGNGNSVNSGKVNTTVTIEAVSYESVSIHIFKEMTPFGQCLDFETTAIMRNGEYEFREIANWKNIAFRYIKENGDSIELLLDCTEFSEDGEDLGRLYGEVYELTKARD